MDTDRMDSDKERILDMVADYCMEQLEVAKNDPSKLSIPLQTVIAIYSAQGIIDNGGFQFFFESDFPLSPPYSYFINAYRRIGAEEAAKNIEAAVEMFGFPDPHLNIQKRRNFLDQIMYDNKNPFHKLGDIICGDESVWGKLADYIIEKIDEFEI